LMEFGIGTGRPVPYKNVIGTGSRFL